MKKAYSILLYLLLCLTIFIVPTTALAQSLEVENTTVEIDDVSDVLEDLSPVVRVSSYTVDGPIEPGGQVTITLNIENSNQYKDAYNILIGFTVMLDDTLYIEEGDPSQIYIEHLAGGETVSRDIRLRCVDYVIYPMTVISFSYYYEGDDGVGHDNSTDISPEITLGVTEATLTINNIIIDDTAVAGEEALLSVQCSNDSEADILNIEMTIIDADSGETVYELGSLDSGEYKTTDCSIIFSETGQQNFEITFAYEDESGIEYQVDGDSVSVNVVDSLKDSEEVSTTSNSFLRIFDVTGSTFKIVLITCITLVLISIILILVMRRKLKAR